jgi:hypothetical protein
LHHAQLAGKLARLLEELRAHENDLEHAARLRVEIAATREALNDRGLLLRAQDLPAQVDGAR